MGKRQKSSDPPTLVARDIQQRIRSIVRQLEELLHPISMMTLHPGAVGPKYFVHFRRNDVPVQVAGMMIGSLVLGLSDEAIQDDAADVALTIWHLHDRILQWLKKSGSSIDLSQLEEQSPSILLCADLANLRKHRKSDNRSGRNPHFGMVEFDTSRSGVLNFARDAAGRSWLWVSEPNPIAFKVRILVDGGMIGDAITVFNAAARDWIGIISQVGIASPTDGHLTEAIQRLNGLEVVRPMTVLELPPDPNFPNPA